MKQTTVTKYVADDGTEFDTEAMCQRHEHIRSLYAEASDAMCDVFDTQLLTGYEAIEYIVDNFVLSRVTLEELTKENT